MDEKLIHHEADFFAQLQRLHVCIEEPKVGDPSEKLLKLIKVESVGLKLVVDVI